MIGKPNTRPPRTPRLRTTAKKARVRGKQSVAPPRPAILRSLRGRRLADWRHARTTGGITAVNGEVLLDEDGKLHVLNGLEHEADGAVASTRREYQTPKGDARVVGQDAALSQAAAKRNLAALEGEDARLAATEARLTQLRGITALGYAVVLGALFLVAVPWDLAATSGLPLAPGVQLLAGLGIGILVLSASHWAAHKEQDVEEARGRQHDDPEEHRLALIQYRAVLYGGIALVIGIGIWRGFTFAAEARATGGIFAGGMWANLVFSVLALVGFFAAYVSAQAYLRLVPLRRVQGERKRNRKERAAQQDIIDNSERIQAEARLTLEFLEQDEAGIIEEVAAWHEARTQQFMHDVRVREHRRRQQLKHGERPAAEPPPAAPAIPAGDLTLRRLDHDERADDATANVTNGQARTTT